MKASIATLVAVLATLGTLQWVHQDTAVARPHEASCADDAPPKAPSKPIAFIGICRN